MTAEQKSDSQNVEYIWYFCAVVKFLLAHEDL